MEGERVWPPVYTWTNLKLKGAELLLCNSFVWPASLKEVCVGLFPTCLPLLCTQFYFSICTCVSVWRPATSVAVPRKKSKQSRPLLLPPPLPPPPQCTNFQFLGNRRTAARPVHRPPDLKTRPLSRTANCSRWLWPEDNMAAPVTRRFNNPTPTNKRSKDTFFSMINIAPSHYHLETNIPQLEWGSDCCWRCIAYKWHPLFPLDTTSNTNLPPHAVWALNRQSEYWEPAIAPPSCPRFTEIPPNYSR